MKIRLIALLGAGLLAAAAAPASPGPQPVAKVAPLPVPQDRAFPGLITLSVDLRDVDRRIVRVHERITGLRANPILLYPQWLPGTHAPEGPIDRVAGIRVSVDGAPAAWVRDPVNVFAFRIPGAAPAQAVDIDFEYLSPTSAKVGSADISHEIAVLEWNNVVLYPAGYFVRQIPVDATVTLPAGWTCASALGCLATSQAQQSFRRVDLETLIDSPVYAGRHARRIDLDPGASVPVQLNLFADRPELLAASPAAIAAYQALVQQAYRLYGSHHYAHYDFLYSLSDQVEHRGLEHHQSSEDGAQPDSFTEWDKNAPGRDLLAHEFTHSWNGKFRRPADLWTPDYSVPMQDSLLWVYEGQTEYWGKVLAARAGLWTLQQALDQLALTAAYYDLQPGRQWRSLADTTNDEIINPRRPMSWTDWQRFEDYYDEGALIWLEADTLIRERSGGKRSLDDFARGFFGINDGSTTVVTYTFADVVKALGQVEPYDWATFLRERIEPVRRAAPLEGLTRGGYRLVYDERPNEFLKLSDTQGKQVNLLFSAGFMIADTQGVVADGTVTDVRWGSAAFNAGITEGAQILSVNGLAYSAELLGDAIRVAKGGKEPIELIVRTGDRYWVTHLDYHDGARYPHLERDPAVPARLDEIFAPRK
jgi:predicted metalloprotease with PDZ domain